MSFDVDDDYNNGAFVSPVMVMGPRAAILAARKPATDTSSDTMALAIAGSQSQGAAVSAAAARPSPLEAAASPAGWLLVLLGLTYIAFHYTYGVGSR